MRNVGAFLFLILSADAALAQAPPSRKRSAPPRDADAIAAPASASHASSASAPASSAATDLPSRRHARAETPKPAAAKPRGAPRKVAAVPNVPAIAPAATLAGKDGPSDTIVAVAPIASNDVREASIGVREASNDVREASIGVLEASNDRGGRARPIAVAAENVAALPPISPAQAPLPPLETTPRIAKPWYELVDASAFIDAYASINPRDPRPDSPAATGIGGNSLRAYDVHNGFALSWIGLNAAYAPEPVGGTIQLRFGPSASIHNATDAAAGLVNVKQAFASVKALERLTIDAGKFDQPLGSEVADSQLNMSYTRSFLYTWAQPLFFTGLRADYVLTPRLDVKLVVANGWNQSLDVNRGKSFGGQITWTPAYDRLSIYAGYVGGPEQPDSQVVVCPQGEALDGSRGVCAASLGAPGGRNVIAVGGANARWRHLTDLVVDWKPSADVRLLANGDYGSEDVGGGSTSRCTAETSPGSGRCRVASRWAPAANTSAMQTAR